MRVADRNYKRGNDEEKAGHIRTAQNCWLRAADYYRQAEFWLAGDDPRRLPTFELMESCSKKFIGHLNPKGEVIDIPYEPGKADLRLFRTCTLRNRETAGADLDGWIG